jgi:hypothetical protein
MGCDYAGKVMFFGSNPKSLIELNNDRKIADNFLSFRDFCENLGFEAIIIDCASGFQNIAASILESTTDIVVCSKITKQFREGTSDFLLQYLDSKKQFLLKKFNNVKIHILPTVVPKNIGNHYAQSIMNLHKSIDSIMDRFDSSISEKDKKTLFARLDKSLCKDGGVSEVNRFKWEEGILNYIARSETLKEDENTAIERYTNVSRHLMEMD